MGTLVMMGGKEPEPIAVTQAKALASALRKVPAVTVRRKGAVVTVTSKQKVKR